ncbi:MAG: MMPL family transporter [Oscillospiraceae bacterium]|nr:MMPL family transporter [Oscillospiraceae bacterium]MCL2279478.1 MMPL family transporter [Oscillospiraceae bacterium]
MGIFFSKVAELIVRGRRPILVLFLILTVVSGWLITQVNINYDMSEYLPNDSPVRRGMDIMHDEFPPSGMLYVMLYGLSDSERISAYEDLSALTHVSSVEFEPEVDRYNRGGHALYIVTIDVDAFSPEAGALIEQIEYLFSEFDMVLSSPMSMPVDILLLVIPAAIIMLVVLLVMSRSWVEPIVFCLSILVAIAINMGTNVFFDSVSDITVSIAAILQVVLCMDYSIMLINRYRQEKESANDKFSAMARALRKSFVTISSCSITTIVAMLMLVFMSFTLGLDLGLVLAKGVLISLVCIFTVTPALILMLDKAIEKTRKPAPHFKMGRLSTFSYKARFVVLAVFVGLFAVSFLVRDDLQITYSQESYDEVFQVFQPGSPVVIIYENMDESRIAGLIAAWDEHPSVDRIDSFHTASEYILSLLPPMPEFPEGLPEGMLFEDLPEGFNPDMMGDFPQDMPADFLPESMDGASHNLLFEQALAEAEEALEYVREIFVGENFSRITLQTSLPGESESAFAFIGDITRDMEYVLAGEFFIVGDLAISYEMHNIFPQELMLITILTALAVFVTAAIAFRSLTVPLILVSVIQCSIFITMATLYFQGSSIMYLALLIVQCLLKGATIDYAILFTAHYREARKTTAVKESISVAFSGSIHTILTSGLISGTITLVLGIVFIQINYPVSEILLLVARGCFIAMALVIFILPSIVSAFDRFVTDKWTRKVQG